MPWDGEVRSEPEKAVTGGPMSTPTRKAEPMTTLRDRITVTPARRGFTPYDPAEDPRRTSFLVEEEGPGATVSFVWDRATDAHRAIALGGYEGVLTANGFAVESRADCLYVHEAAPAAGEDQAG